MHKSNVLNKFFQILFLLIISFSFSKSFAKENILQIKANMVVDTPTQLLELVDRARAKGATVVKYADTKLNRFGLGESPGAIWESRTREFIEGVKARDMKIILNTITIGYCSSLIASDTNLASGYPIERQKLEAVGKRLVPVSTAPIKNGGFESFNGNNPSDWGFQDAAGQRTFIDTDIKYSGNASFRAEAKNGELSRVITTFPVKPFHQYTLSFWMKTENLSANNVAAIVRNENNKDRFLTQQSLSFVKNDGGRAYFNRASNLTKDWTQMRIAFNSLDANKVNLGLSVFGGQAGKIWYDDVRIDDTPTLNWLNRNDLPTQVKNITSQKELTFGQDIESIIDPFLGNVPYPGSFATSHQAPKINIKSSTRINEGDIVELSGYHAMITARGQTSCSWNNEAVFARMSQIHTNLWNEFEPTGFLINYDEIRTGGYEPSDTDTYSTSGEALAASIERAYNDVFAIAPNAKHYFWSDMIDPFHNARSNFYQINNTLENAWTTLDPNRVTLITWWEGQKINDLGPDSLRFFSSLGFKQILGAFYDEDVQVNFDRWQSAAQGVNAIEGAMYASWKNPPNYSQIERFGDLWWNDVATSIDEIGEFTLNETLIPGQTYTVRVPYSTNQVRDMTLSFQNTTTNWSNHGYDRITLDPDEGIAEFALNVDADALSGGEYAITVALLPSGGNWNSRIKHLTLQDISVQSDIENNIDNGLVANGNFADIDNDWNYWQTNSGISNCGLNGSNGMLLDDTSSGGAWQPIEFESEKTYRVSMWGKSTIEGREGAFGVQFRRNGNIVSQGLIEFSSPELEYREIQITTPKREAYDSSFVFIYKNPNGAEVCVDGVSILKQ